ncbi:TonB-dependent receptor-like protein [Sphingomonas sp. PP-CE-3G-477]|nr:TonB-dependent receptor-like protein [Sphingomonas sp. PP-CE-3G-477]
MILSRLLGATAIVGALALLPSMAAAQDVPNANSPPVNADGSEPADTAQAASGAEEILVTGSRIRRANDESPNPITTISAADIFSAGRVSVGDVLNDLPQLRSTVGSQNSTSGLGVRGLNLIDLRGLGTARTLVLVNGRRHVSAEIINNGNSPDINTFPTDLIEKVDIVTGGSSAVYGSDAIAGVVNFILKDHYDGLDLHGQTGISKYGDAGNQYLSAVAGKNFADGRGNIAVNLEYAHQQDYYASGRPNLRQNDGFVVVDTDPAGSVNGSDSIPDRIFVRDIRSTTISTGGQVGIRYANTATAPCGVDSAGSSFTCGYLFQPGGALAPQTGTRLGLGPNGSFTGGNGYTGREGRLLVLSPELNRYAANLIGHFEVSPAFVPFIEAKYVRSEARGSQSGPFFSQGQTLADAIPIAGLNDRSYVLTNPTGNGPVNREGIRLDNPYLSTSARATLTSQLTAAVNSGVNPNTGAAFGTTPAGIALRNASLAQIAAGTYRFSSRRNYVDLGIRDENIRRETYRLVGGIRGDFNSDWHYELSGNYGEHRERNVIQGNINRQRFLLANDTARNAAGQIVCRSQVDSRYAGTDRAGNAAVLAADVAACVPLNPFGDGSISQAARQYLTVSTVATGKATQFQGTGYMSGDLSQLFELPGGPIAFSLGGEYRRETLSYDLDPTTQAGYAFYNAIPSFRSPAFEVKEAFGEISIPLVKNVPLLQELTINGSGRVADYKGAVGTVYAYGGGVNWRPVRDLMMRGSYAKSVRAPYLGDLYSAQSQNFTPAPNDPCSARNIGTGSATRAANCAAQGAPAGYDYVYTSSLEIVSGGNPNLQAETSKSYTFGGVFEPRFLPGLSISTDYYNITVDKVISAVSAQQILNLCYDSPTLNNPFCGLFQRAGAGGGARGEIPFRVLEGSLLQSTANFAKQKATGIDTNINYNHRFGWGEVSARGIWTHVIQRDNYTNPADANFKNTLTGELGDPSDQFNIAADVKIGKVSFGYSVRWIDKMYLNTFEDYNALNGQPPQNTDYATIEKYPAVTYHDIRASVDVSERFNAYFGVNNISNRLPPYGLTGITANSGIYDNRGRFGYVGVTAKF